MWNQCQQRYKTILKRETASVDNNRTSGSKRKYVEFQEELVKIAALDDSIEPELLISSNKISRKSDNGAGFRIRRFSTKFSNSDEDEDVSNKSLFIISIAQLTAVTAFIFVN